MDSHELMDEFHRQGHSTEEISIASFVQSILRIDTYESRSICSRFFFKYWQAERMENLPDLFPKFIQCFAVQFVKVVRPGRYLATQTVIDPTDMMGCDRQIDVTFPNHSVFQVRSFLLSR